MNNDYEITAEMVKRLEEVKKRRNSTVFFCASCNNQTKQSILFEKGELVHPKEIIYFDEKGDRIGNAWTIEGRIWKLSQCLGCDKTNLNVFERYHPLEDDILIHHYPTKPQRSFPLWVTYLGKEFTELFAEVYISLNTGNIRLPVMGARTLLDMFIVEKIGDAGTFKTKLQKLVAEQYISATAKELLEVVLDYGNATIHRGYKPTIESVHGVFDIIENILHTEALKRQTADLKNNAPKKK